MSLEQFMLKLVYSLIPAGVNIMALTATATLDIVSRMLCLTNPTIIALPPHLNNVAYQIHSKVELDVFTYDELASKRPVFPKTIIYVRTYRSRIDMYMTKLGAGFTEPPGYPNLSGY